VHKLHTEKSTEIAPPPVQPLSTAKGQGMDYIPYVFLFIMGGVSLAATFTSPVF